MKYEPIPGQAHNPTEEETMSVIRSVLIGSDEPVRGRKATRAERKAAERAEAGANAKNGSRARAFVERTMQPYPRRRAADLPELAVDEEAPKKREFRMPKFVSSLGRPIAAVAAKLGGFRPSVRLTGLLALALLVVLRPHWFVITGIVLFVLVFGSFLILGSDRIWGFVLACLNYVEARDRKRADHMRDRLDEFACHWDSILDRFPDGWVEALYMPDLQAMKEADDAYHAALDSRIDRMASDV